MNKLFLSSKEKSCLTNTINELENKYGKSCNYTPSASFASCTCQGNCDGPTGSATCQWG